MVDRNFSIVYVVIYLRKLLMSIVLHFDIAEFHNHLCLALKNLQNLY